MLTAKRVELEEAGDANKHTKKSTKLYTPRAYSHIIGILAFSKTVSTTRSSRHVGFNQFIIFTLSYAFPPWLSSTIITLSWSLGRPSGFSVQINLERIRSYDDPIWQLAKTGNVDGIRHEFERSQASPFMVDPDGRSLLWVGTASR